ncbi:MAG TPA: hypothetical protein VFB19_18490 [Mycobacterium sp.]|nr:hypothetical protein [Mycobacterium sp.]
MDDLATLPPFPVDDFTLDQIEHALGGSLGFADGDPEPHLVGADFSLSALLDFLSGYDESRLVQAVNEYDTPIPDTFEYPDPIYHVNDVLRALIAEVRRLRGSDR